MTNTSIIIHAQQEFGLALRSARRSRKLTQVTAAMSAGVSARLWNEVETNKPRAVTLERAIRMAQIVGLDLRLVPRPGTGETHAK